MRKFAWIGFAIALALALGIHHGRQKNTLIRFIWPPSDLYTDLAVAPLDIAVRGAKARLSVMPRYEGAHTVDLHFPGTLSIGSPPNPPLLLDVIVSERSRVRWREATGKLAAYVEGGGSGYVLHWASGDRAWEPGDSIEVTVRVVEPDTALQAGYGAATVRVGRSSDE